MEPIPATLEAIRELTRYGDTDVAVALLKMSRAVQELVPTCVGLSLATIDDGLTFTLTATDAEIAGLDAVQYLGGGPCVDAIQRGEVNAVTTVGRPETTDEEAWHLFAKASAASGIASTLSLPIIRHGRVIAGVNLYGAAEDSFDDLHDEGAEVCGAWAPGAVTNADLSFRTRTEAEAAPQRIHDQNVVSQAIGMLAASAAIDVATASDRLQNAADRAGISESQAARAVIGVLADSA